MSKEDMSWQPFSSGLERPMSRLSLLKRSAGVAGAVAAGGVLASGEARAATAAPEVPPPPLRFFTQWEFDYVTAMAETIWPTDDLGPGAREGRRRLLHRRPARRQLGPGAPVLPQRARSSTGRHGSRVADPDDAGRCLPGVPARFRRLRPRRRYGNPYPSSTADAADAGDDRPPDRQGGDPARRARRRSRARTSSRCSARTCSRGCSPTRRTAATGTWSAGSGSGSPATRCAVATCTRDYIFTQEAVSVREQAAAAGAEVREERRRDGALRRPGSKKPANAATNKGGM